MWLDPGTSVTFAFARAAIQRSRSGLMVLSAVGITIQLGLVSYAAALNAATER